MKNFIVIILFIMVFGCTKFEDAELTKRDSFIHFYSSGVSFIGSSAEIDRDGGFIITGEIPSQSGNIDALIIKTDAKGFKVWEKTIENTKINSIKPSGEGYILIGDGIELDADNENISEHVNTQAKLFFMDTNGNILQEYTKRRQVVVSNDTLEVDYHGNAFTWDTQGNFFLLGSYKEPGSFQRSFVSEFNEESLTEVWSQSYGLGDMDYINCNELFVTPTQRLVWASQALRQNQNISRQYVSVSFVKVNSTFDKYFLFGQNDDRNHTAANVHGSASGYAVTGTYANTDGSAGNTYFMRVNQEGNIIENSTRYFDGAAQLDISTNLANRDASSIEDGGTAVTVVKGGFVIAGKIASTTTIGNGGEDIVLIKLDHQGNFIWSKIIGGTGDETPASIRETSDGGLLVCGSNNINGLSSIMLIKTDSKGEIIN